MVLDPARCALVVIDPQVDFLTPQGVAWSLVGESVTENGVVDNLDRLFAAAKRAGVVVAVSPHYYYPTDHEWDFGGASEKLMHDICMFDRSSPVSMDGFENSGADYLPQFKPYILDGKTIICSPHKVYGPESNDLVLQLRKKGISQVVLAGMAANLCVESHLRELMEQGFEVAVVRDATAGPRTPEGDGYLAAMINFRYLASALWTTGQVVDKLAA
ncbi:isochorismatase family cysteine hydrolase [Rugamonas sp.]|uniref:isochorismatase family cysteine hydrolase n=1 Tax=Rugamonas sp. TaxID=1926287 RepID=UPI0025FB7EA2|nr:isochorismatase family cysteine hydrolase [Rugamonas sp.]